ncbi:hypothetical protein SUGI_0449080 [Cryptomeria japonica]|nr:hypothetical protein SUGI_0449080 [Cryptomeria japonica]
MDKLKLHVLLVFCMFFKLPAGQAVMNKHQDGEMEKIQLFPIYDEYTVKEVSAVKECSACKCCSAGNTNCIQTSCCYGFVCNEPGKPNGTCVFKPLSCSCDGCN